LQNYYSDIRTLGKHYTVSAINNGNPVKVSGRVLRRHYTITNCMVSAFYKELIRLLSTQSQPKRASLRINQKEI